MNVKSFHFIFISIFTLFFSWNSLAAQFKGFGLNLTGPDQRWVVSPMKISSVENGWLYAQTYTRYIFEVERPYELGNISYYSMPFNKQTEKITSVVEVQKAFEKMFDIKPFVLSQYKGRKNQWMLQGEYAKHGRFVRMLITKHKNRFSFSIAYLRKPYLESIDESAAWIQDKIIDREDQLIEKVFDKKTTSIFDFFPKAYAGIGGIPPGWTSQGGFGIPPKATSGTFDPITIIKADGSTIQVQPCSGPSPLPTTQNPTACPSPNSCPQPTPMNAVAYTNCIQNISDCRMQQLQQTANSAQGQIHSVQQDIKCQSDWWSAKMDHYSEEWGARADRGLDILEKAFDPANVAAMAAAGVIGASVASFGMSLAISGIEAGAEALWKLVSGAYAEEKHQEIVKIFMENKEKWDQMNEEAMNLSGLVDRSMDLLNLVKLSGKSLEQIIIENKSKMVELETSVEDAKEKYTKVKNQFHDDENNICVVEARNQYNLLKKEFVLLQGQLAKLDDVKTQHGSFEAMCSVLKHNLDTLLQLEGDIQNARVLMLKSYDHFQIEEGRRREKMRESGRDLQLENAKKTYKDEVERAQRSFKAGIQSAEIASALEDASEACYDENISRNGWHNIICRVPILAPVPLIGGVSDDQDAGMEAACYHYQKKCQKIEEKKNYLYRIAHENLGDYKTKKRNELIRAHRQYSGLVNTYESDLKIAKETYDQKLKVKEYLNYNEDTSRAKTEAVHNWMMSMRLEQACSNLPDTCDDKAGFLFTPLKNTIGAKNEVIKRTTIDGKSEISCECQSSSAICNCPQIKESEYFKCRQTKNDCDANKQGLVCYNLPYCPGKAFGDSKDYSHCSEFCPQVEASCLGVKTNKCIQQSQLHVMCMTQFKTCGDEGQQTGCEIHFNKKCEGSEEFCSGLTKTCREQALNRSKFRFEKIKVQSDLLKTGACKEVLR